MLLLVLLPVLLLILLLVLLLVLFDFNIIVFYLPLLGSFYGVLSATGHRGWSGGGVLRSGEGVMLGV